MRWKTVIMHKYKSNIKNKYNMGKSKNQKKKSKNTVKTDQRSTQDY